MLEKAKLVNSWIIPTKIEADSIAEASLLSELGRPWHGPIPEASLTPLGVLRIQADVILGVLTEPSDTARRCDSVAMYWTIEAIGSNSTR